HNRVIPPSHRSRGSRTAHRSLPFAARPPPDLSTLSLHDALPICSGAETRAIVESQRGVEGEASGLLRPPGVAPGKTQPVLTAAVDRKSTRLNSSHRTISYAVFCLKKKMDLADAGRRASVLSGAAH